MHQVNHYYVLVSKARLCEKLSEEIVQKIIRLLSKQQMRVSPSQVLLLIDQDTIAGMKHLRACIHFALKAFKQKNNTANTLATEILLYLSGNRQVSKAISKVGLSTKTENVLFIQMIKIIPERREIIQFDFKEFFTANGIEMSEFSQDIEVFYPTDYVQVKLNLNITDRVIQLFTNEMAKSEHFVLERLAIEKSALLNLDK